MTKRRVRWYSLPVIMSTIGPRETPRLPQLAYLAWHAYPYQPLLGSPSSFSPPRFGGGAFASIFPRADKKLRRHADAHNLRDDVVFNMNVTVGDSHKFSKGNASSAPRLQMEVAAFDAYADAALALERAYVRRHGPGAVFKWVVFTDSAPLRLALETRWERAALLDLGRPSHSGCAAGASARVEWLVLSKCDMLVVSRSGFSETAAAYSTTAQFVELVNVNRAGDPYHHEIDGTSAAERWT